MKSDKIESGRYGSHGPWVSIYWDEVKQDIANNRTQVRLRFYFEWDRKINYVFHSKSGSLYGSSFTYSGTARQNSGYGYVTLREQYVWISHDSNGTKSVTFSASINNLGLYWSGTTIGTMSVSGTVRLTDIPRKHTVSGATMGADIKPSTANTLTVTGSAPYTGHYYWAGIYDGSTNIYAYKVGTREYHTGNPIGTYTLDSSVVNVMLNRMRNVTSKKFRFRLWTYSGNGTGNLGESAVDFTVTVDSTVKPTISGLKASIWGTRRDKTINKYVQNYSYVESSFSSSGGYGSTITSNYITVRQDGTKANSQTINSNDGATSGVVTRSGTYEVIATAIDSRGRSNTARTTFDVQAYSPPYISSFKAERQGGISATVDVDAKGGWSNLGGSNNLTVKIQRRVTGGSYTNATDDSTKTGGSFSESFPTTGNNVSSSYQYKLRISDTFGNVAESVVLVGTAKVLFDKHQDKGIGIGKLHERGELDVAGEAYFEGELFLNNVPIVDEGNNENGEWVKFYDGTMICRGYVNKTLTVNQAWGSLYYANVGKLTFPVAFSAVPYVEPINSSAHAVFIATTANNTSRTQTGDIDIYRPTTSNSASYSIGFVAIGRWKN